MYQDVLSFFGIGLLTGLFAVATIIGTAMRIDKDPAVDGPRALDRRVLRPLVRLRLPRLQLHGRSARTQWILRGIAATAAIIGFIFAAFFAGTPEVRVRLDQDPTGFETPITALELNQPGHTSNQDRHRQHQPNLISVLRFAVLPQHSNTQNRSTFAVCGYPSLSLR